MKDKHTTWERLFSAVKGLAASDRSIKDRLDGAILILSALKTEEFPEELQKDIEDMRKQLKQTKETLSNQTCSDIIKEMSNSECCEIAEKIVSIFNTVACDYCDSQKES